MFNALLKMLGLAPPEPCGPAVLLKEPKPEELGPISSSASWEKDELRVQADAKETIRVWEFPIKTQDACQFECRFDLRSADLAGDVYPEMWCRVSGMGEAFSKGLHYRLSGDNDWVSCSLPFYLKPNEFIENVRFQLVFSAAGEAAVRHVEFYQTPLQY